VNASTLDRVGSSTKVLERIGMVMVGRGYRADASEILQLRKARPTEDFGESLG
jgi:hypothetical protein